VGRTVLVIAGLVAVLATGRPASAQSPEAAAAPDEGANTQSLVVRNPFQPAPPVPPALTRPAILPPLYVGFAALQVFDGYTTTHGVGIGVTEANPFFEPFAGHPMAVWAMKAGVTAGAIAAAEQLWRRRRRSQAIAVMVVSNAVMGLVATHNASVTRATP
jgi:hypothetical protein